MELTEKFLITWWVLLYGDFGLVSQMHFHCGCFFFFVMKEEAFICFLAHNFVGRYGWRDKSDLIGTTVESGLTASYERN